MLKQMLLRNFCTCHDSHAVVACAKIWSDSMIINWITITKMLHKIWYFAWKSISKMIPADSMAACFGLHDLAMKASWKLDAIFIHCPPQSSLEVMCWSDTASLLSEPLGCRYSCLNGGHYWDLLSWYPIFKSSHNNSFEDQASVDVIYSSTGVRFLYNSLWSSDAEWQHRWWH